MNSQNKRNKQLKQAKAVVDELNAKNYKYPIGSSEAMVRGIRQIGYKSNAKACSEHIDNALQAGASEIHIDLICSGKGRTKSNVTEIAITDNACGMNPGMQRFMMCVGGTSRENDRTGYGRFGYGAPASALSLGTEWSTYTRTEDSESITECSFDCSDLNSYQDKEGNVCIPEPKNSSLPSFLEGKGYLEGSGTAVVISGLDTLQYKTVSTLSDLLVRELSTIFYKVIKDGIKIYVGDVKLTSIDPIFEGVTDGGPEPDIATPITIPVKNPNGKGTSNLIVRMSRLPYGSLGKDFVGDRVRDNTRNKTVRAFTGIVFSRNERVIDCHSEHNQLKDMNIGRWNNYDAYIRVQIEFPPTLDELFNLNTAKQHIRIDRELANLIGSVKEFTTTLASWRKENAKNVQFKRVEAEKEKSKERTEFSEKVLSEVAETIRVDVDDADLKAEEGQKAIEEEAKKVAEITGRSVKEEQEKISEDSEKSENTIEIFTVDHEGGGPYWCKPWGKRTRLYINIAHILIQEIYLKSDARMREKLHVWMFAYSYHDLNATEVNAELYNSERSKWFSSMELGMTKVISNSGEEALEDPVNLQIVVDS